MEHVYACPRDSPRFCKVEVNFTNTIWLGFALFYLVQRLFPYVKQLPRLFGRESAQTFAVLFDPTSEA